MKRHAIGAVVIAATMAAMAPGTTAEMPEMPETPVTQETSPTQETSGSERYAEVNAWCNARFPYREDLQEACKWGAYEMLVPMVPIIPEQPTLTLPEKAPQGA